MSNKISEDTIDSFILEMHSALQYNPLWLQDEDEGYAYFREFVHERFDKFWGYMIKERNYN